MTDEERDAVTDAEILGRVIGDVDAFRLLRRFWKDDEWDVSIQKSSVTRPTDDWEKKNTTYLMYTVKIRKRGACKWEAVARGKTLLLASRRALNQVEKETA